MDDVIVIGGRFFVYDEETHQMVETDETGCPLTQRSRVEGE